MGAAASRVRPMGRPFAPSEFTVAWLTFKGDSVENTDHRYVAKKDGLVSSKLLHRLFGDSTMACFVEQDGEYISREMFICTLAMGYDGNTEDRISYIFTMYSIIYGLERESDGCIIKRDYTYLLEYLEAFNFIPKKFYAAFDECGIPSGGMLLTAQFLEWVRRYPVLIEITIEGSKQCLIVGFMINMIALKYRFKVIAQVTNQEECGLTGMAKKLLVSHNATPVLTRPQHRIYHFNDGSTEVVVDVHAFSYIARRGIHMLLDKTSKLVIDIAFVLQGETEDELPERILVSSTSRKAYEHHQSHRFSCAEQDHAGPKGDINTKFMMALQELHEIKNEVNDLSQQRQRSAPVLATPSAVPAPTARPQRKAPLLDVDSASASQRQDGSSCAGATGPEQQQPPPRDLQSPRQRLQVAEMVMRKLYRQNLQSERELAATKSEVASLQRRIEELESERCQTDRAVPPAAPSTSSASSTLCARCAAPPPPAAAESRDAALLSHPPTAETLARIDETQLEYLRHLATEQDKTISTLKLRIEELSSQLLERSKPAPAPTTKLASSSRKASKARSPSVATARLQGRLQDALLESERQRHSYLQLKRDFQHLLALKTRSLADNPTVVNANARELVQLLERQLQQLEHEHAHNRSLYNSQLFEAEQLQCESYAQQKLLADEMARLAQDVEQRDALDQQIEQCMVSVFERLHQVETENVRLRASSEPRR
ncbi:hypothetical protein P43SY_004378 [Pythium insidiosum]|uniref:Protein ENHANCED DISEASE RESISTANCE 2 C-terminal domain-containing protein n=1 Tax=Pythium insidiosum TaxID=114742 RepID=A0AAD5LPG3_PYTIN|nr:hypothetical protein P43SY_004378 [Pythium insidiosum]